MVNVVIGTSSQYFWVDGASNAVNFYWKSDNFWGAPMGTANNLFDGNWHFICGTFKYTSSTQYTVSLYLDNLLLNSTINSSTYPTGGVNIRINAYASSGNYNMNTGYVDNIRYYNFPLNTDQMTAIYSSRT
jgi:hypothetical protein